MESASTKSSLSVAVDKSKLLPPEQSAVPVGAECKRDCGRIQLGAAAYAGIIVGGLFVMSLMGFVVARGLKANEGRDADKSAQLAYMNEMTEGDMDADEDGGIAAAEVVVPTMPPTRQTRLLLWLGGLPEPEERLGEGDEEVRTGLVGWGLAGRRQGNDIDDGKPQLQISQPGQSLSGG